MLYTINLYLGFLLNESPGEKKHIKILSHELSWSQFSTETSILYQRKAFFMYVKKNIHCFHCVRIVSARFNFIYALHVGKQKLIKQEAGWGLPVLRSSDQAQACGFPHTHG